MGIFVRVLSYGALGIAMGAAPGGLRGGWEGALGGAAMGFAIFAFFGLVFAVAEMVAKKMPPKVQRILFQRVLPGEAFIAPYDSQAKRD